MWRRANLLPVYSKCTIKDLPPSTIHQKRFNQSLAVSEGSDAKPMTFFPFRASETDPAKLNSSHLGRFFTVDETLFKDVYKPIKAFPKDVGPNFETFREVCILVRKPYLDLKSCIEASDLSKPVVRYLLHGPCGSGKNMTLFNLLHYAHTQKYILVSVPWANVFTLHVQETVQSPTREGFFDHTIDAVAWLHQFKVANSELVTNLELKTQKTYAWTKREETPQGSALLEIVEHGISRPAHASECIYALIGELKNLSTQKKCKTMAIIGGINAFYYEYRTIKRPDRSLVPPTQITLFEAFKQIIKPDWSGGVVVCGVDKDANPKEIRESELPRYLLTKEGFEQFDPFVPISVENYSSQETQTTIDYYLDRKWLQHPEAGSELGRVELEFLSTRNPQALMELCSSR